MKRIKKILAVLAWLYFLSSRQAFAHPLDQSYWEINFHSENPSQIDSRFYISWQQLSYLSELYKEESQYQDPEIDFTKGNAFDLHIANLLSKPFMFEGYLTEHFQVFQDDKSCQIEFMPVPEPEKPEILVGKGIKLEAIFHCPQQVSQVSFFSDFLQDKFDYQTTQLVLYKNGDVLIEKVILDKNNRRINVNLKDFSWKKTAEEKQGNYNLTGMQKNLTDKLGVSFWQMIIVMFLLGLLHTFETGHSKAILLAVVSNKHTRFSHALAYITVFTVTHISDILILGLAFVIIGSFVDIYQILPNLHKFSLYALLALALYLLYKNTKHLKQAPHRHSHKQKSSGSFKQQLMIGFITGLSPCLFGWSLFLIILSNKSIWFVFPAILSFGLGIATELSLIALAFYFFKKKLYGRLEIIGRWSPIISSLILVFYSLAMIWGI